MSYESTPKPDTTEAREAASHAAPDGWSIEFSYGSYQCVEDSTLQRVPYESTYEGSHSEASARERYQKAVAAPALYEALKGFMSSELWRNTCDYKACGCETSQLFDAAERALAKAEGKK